MVYKLKRVLFFTILLICAFPATSFAENILVIDPGHGGQFDGTCGYSGDETGFCEKDANLLVVLKLRDILEESTDITVYMTRETDVDFVEDTSIPVWHRDRLLDDMENRMKVANQFVEGNNDNSLFLSIHHNQDVNSSNTGGTETYYYDGINHLNPRLPPHPLQLEYRDDSKRFAEIVHENVLNALGLRDRELRNNQNFYVLRKAQMPAVLVEIAFLTNPEEEALIKTEEFQLRSAQALANSVKVYFEVYDVIEEEGVKEEGAMEYAEEIDPDEVTVFFKKTEERVYPKVSQGGVNPIAYCTFHTTKHFFGTSLFKLLSKNIFHLRKTGTWCS
ncbi:N-acetylmuramoyl-L-alanine amidase [Evansella vedderi]|uniref:N-acetylmuramoyl-L-alanine amidase n=1 Tax=Evansella vedderi TaxID=38282 RepID=A0ABT9ZRQ8_9BACI|nr:N-acetylmuramoyl-L-alanine amidase [Evansella vedderi]MDQ0253148.1 N-acetylmuramoyl-L-alanine amidase [Evansella vedderi]